MVALVTQPRLVIGGLLVTGLFLTGCSGSAARQGEPAVDQPTAAGLQSAAARDADDFFSLNVGAYYNDLSAACRKKITVENLATAMTEGDAAAKKQLATGLKGLRAGGVQTRDVTAATGQALVTIVKTDGSQLAATPQFDAYVYEAGKWRTTVCGN